MDDKLVAKLMEKFQMSRGEAERMAGIMRDPDLVNHVNTENMRAAISAKAPTQPPRAPSVEKQRAFTQAPPQRQKSPVEMSNDIVSAVSGQPNGWIDVGLGRNDNPAAQAMMVGLRRSLGIRMPGDYPDANQLMQQQIRSGQIADPALAYPELNPYDARYRALQTAGGQ
jgi:hypothetical protein